MTKRITEPRKRTRTVQIKFWATPEEKELIENVLQHFGYNKTHAANFLNISRPLLHQKMKRLGIASSPPSDKNQQI